MKLRNGSPLLVKSAYYGGPLSLPSIDSEDLHRHKNFIYHNPHTQEQQPLLYFAPTYRL